MSEQSCTRQIHVPGMPASVIRLYVSLIFIILSFVLGAFAGEGFKQLQPSAKETPLAVPNESPASFPQRLAGQMELTDLFAPGTAGINESSAAALVQVLKSHDINLRAEIYPDAGRSLLTDQDAFDLAVRRALSLTYYFIAEGVPRGALSLYAATPGEAEYARGVQARATFLVVRGER